MPNDRQPTPETDEPVNLDATNPGWTDEDDAIMEEFWQQEAARNKAKG